MHKKTASVATLHGQFMKSLLQLVIVKLVLRGRPASKTQPFIAAYLEAIFFVNPFLYLGEMQGRLRADLNLLPHEVPSVPVICRTLHDLNLTKHKST